MLLACFYMYRRTRTNHWLLYWNPVVKTMYEKNWIKIPIKRNKNFWECVTFVHISRSVKKNWGTGIFNITMGLDTIWSNEFSKSSRTNKWLARMSVQNSWQLARPGSTEEHTAVWVGVYCGLAVLCALLSKIY